MTRPISDREGVPLETALPPNRHEDMRDFLKLLYTGTLKYNCSAGKFITAWVKENNKSNYKRRADAWTREDIQKIARLKAQGLKNREIAEIFNKKTDCITAAYTKYPEWRE